jgi:hypothetical protein
MMNCGSSQIESIEPLSGMVKELYNLLELYAPPWYTKELHEKAEAVVLMLESAGDRSNGPLSSKRAIRGIGHDPSN